MESSSEKVNQKKYLNLVLKKIIFNPQIFLPSSLLYDLNENFLKLQNIL